MLLFPDEVEGQTSTLLPDATGAAFERLELGGLGVPLAVTSGPNGEIYVALQKSSIPGQSRHFGVVTLQPQ